MWFADVSQETAAICRLALSYLEVSLLLDLMGCPCRFALMWLMEGLHLHQYWKQKVKAPLNIWNLCLELLVADTLSWGSREPPGSMPVLLVLPPAPPGSTRVALSPSRVLPGSGTLVFALLEVLPPDHPRGFGLQHTYFQARFFLLLQN